MSIYRSTDPTTFDDVDQIVINEIQPPASISGVATNIACLVGQFQRGPVDTLVEVGSTGEFNELYGVDASKSGNLELKNKKFGRLKIVRAAAAAAAKSTFNFDDGVSTDILQFDALYEGAYGDLIKVTVEVGTDTGKKYTVQDTNPDAVLPIEVYDNIVVTEITASTFAASKLVAVTVLATSAEPADAAATALAAGSDGTIADSDYTSAIAVVENDQLANILWCDTQSTAIKDDLEQHVLNNPNKIVIIAPDDDTVDKTAALAEVVGYRSDRIIYAYPYVTTRVNGAEVSQSPACWYASILSQLAPQKDPATVEAVGFTGGITGLKQDLNRAAYINLKDGGVSAFEFDPDFGYKVKTGCVTLLTPGLTQVLRRRMADFLTNSIGKFLKTYQNKVNSAANRGLVGAAIMGFDKRLENEGILPGAADVSGGSPVLVDTESLNTADSIANGFFKIQYKRRIFSAMRFIVLVAEIGQGVIVTEAE